jgi:hypothetical protein
MPTPTKYESGAARQRAYRKRVQEARFAERELKGLPRTPAIPSIPSTARWRAMIAEAHTLLSEAEREIQDYIDERSEVWQESERAEHLEECRQAIEEVIDSLQTIEV